MQTAANIYDPAEPCRVVLLGNTLLIADVQSSLSGFPGLELTCLEQVSADDLAGLRPDALVFDASAAAPCGLLALLQACPKVLLVGLDPSRDEALLVRGSQSTLSHLRDLPYLLSCDLLRFNV